METDDKNVILSFSSDRLSGDIYMVKLKGSTVVEMAYLMPVVLLCWMAIIFALFYYHDKNIIGGAAYETAIVGSEEWRWQKEIEDGKLFEKVPTITPGLLYLVNYPWLKPQACRLFIRELQLT